VVERAVPRLVDPRTSLAMSMYADPGAYAVLLGSGVSKGAGIMTAWEVTEDLIRQVAVGQGVHLAAVGLGPVEWWMKEGNGEPNYSDLLDAISPTDAARQALLRQYFEPRLSAREPLVPSAAHDALATLVAAGRVQLILTTNFDHLTEMALQAAGISPQVISDPDAVKGMIPLERGRPTVLKLHGDYTRPGLRNTEAELRNYPSAWKDLLAQVFDRFGLVVVGWSAEYDQALVRAIEEVVARRYPTYWANYLGQPMKQDALRLVSVRQATVIPVDGADEFFADLVRRIDRFDAIAALRSRPRTQRGYVFPPHGRSMPGWAVLPLLQLRVCAALTPVTLETLGFIRSNTRDRIVRTLTDAPLTASLLRYADRCTWVSSSQPSVVVHQQIANVWLPTDEYRQTTDTAGYRLGTDGTAGVSCLGSIQTPSNPSLGGQVLVTIDMGFSIEPAFSALACAELIRDGLLLAAVDIPAALIDLLPPDAAVTRVEAHFLAARDDGTPQQGHRDNDVAKRIDLSSFGRAPAEAIGVSAGWAALLGAPITQLSAAELAADAIDYILYASGWLNPDGGLRALRGQLGLPETDTLDNRASSLE
jgi:SIR2-like protein